ADSPGGCDHADEWIQGVFDRRIRSAAAEQCKRDRQIQITAARGGNRLWQPSPRARWNRRPRTDEPESQFSVGNDRTENRAAPHCSLGTAPGWLAGDAG